MKCYVCSAKTGALRDAIGMCRFCNVGLCTDHFAELAHVAQGGMHYTCNHYFPEAAVAAVATEVKAPATKRAA